MVFILELVKFSPVLGPWHTEFPLPGELLSLFTSAKLSPPPPLSSQALHTIYGYKGTCLLNADLLVKCILPEAGDYFLLAQHYVLGVQPAWRVGGTQNFSLKE